jgi:hypothetical protein
MSRTIYHSFGDEFCSHWADTTDLYFHPIGYGCDALWFWTEFCHDAQEMLFAGR